MLALLLALTPATAADRASDFIATVDKDVGTGVIVVTIVDASEWKPTPAERAAARAQAVISQAALDAHMAGLPGTTPAWYAARSAAWQAAWREWLLKTTY